ncbi:MAG: hypothetical protein IKN74_01360 [Clostridia bacterium]|nr:hypothetical protein [Clostridia bacterium]
MDYSGTKEDTLPDGIRQDSIVEFSYSGFLRDSSKLFIEYSYDGFESSRTLEMQKKPGGFSVRLYIDGTEKISYRFFNSNGDVDSGYYSNVFTAIDKESYFDIENPEEEMHVIVDSSISDAPEVTPYKDLYDIKKEEEANYKEDDVTLDVDDGKQLRSELALIPLDQRGLQYPRHGLRPLYKLSKKIKLAILKLLRYFPKLKSGNYKKDTN